MARQYWLMKTEPNAYSWDDLVREGTTPWDGVRNYQARNNLQAMKKGDLALIYHSVGPKEIVGVARIHGEARQDPTTEDARWVVTDIEPVVGFEEVVTLAAVKAHDLLQDMALVRQSRLSVAPVTREEFEVVLELGKTKLPRGKK